MCHSNLSSKLTLSKLKPTLMSFDDNKE